MRFFRWLRRVTPHEHDWRMLGYGGCGWFVVQCATCGKMELE